MKDITKKIANSILAVYTLGLSYGTSPASSSNIKINSNEQINSILSQEDTSPAKNNEDKRGLENKVDSSKNQQSGKSCRKEAYIDSVKQKYNYSTIRDFKSYPVANEFPSENFKDANPMSYAEEIGKEYIRWQRISNSTGETDAVILTEKNSKYEFDIDDFNSQWKEIKSEEEYLESIGKGKIPRIKSIDKIGQVHLQNPCSFEDEIIMLYGTTSAVSNVDVFVRDGKLRVEIPESSDDRGSDGNGEGGAGGGEGGGSGGASLERKKLDYLAMIENARNLWRKVR